MIRLFESAIHAQSYAKFRPVYPDSVVQRIIEFCKAGAGSSFRRAVDVACGSGQSTELLVPHFSDCVFGVDISAAQIAAAKSTSPKLRYLVGTAEDLSCIPENDSVDLVTCAQALHWTEPEKFYKEAKRILKPGGVLAVYGYGNQTLDLKEGTDKISQFYRNVVGKYWDNRRRHIDNHYRDFILPFTDYTRDDSLVMTKRMPLTAFIGYVSTWSAYQQLLKEQPNNTVLQELGNSLLRIYQEKEPADVDADVEVVASWPIFILLGRKS